jgi:lysophospholipase L1-like esterase
MESMMKRAKLRAVSAAAILALAAAVPAAAQTTPNFTKYVALGDSYGAGYGAGCLVARHQAFSGPNILAKQLGVSDFQQPTISDPGIPTCNALLSLVPSVTFGPISTKMGVPTNALLSRPYDNLSVPGFKIADVSDTVSGGLADVVLRGKGSALNQALSLNPTFITLTIVGNDILNAPGAGFLLDGVTATPLPLFTAKYNAVAAALKANGRTGVFLGTGDVQQLPLLTAIKPVVTDATGTPVLVGGQTIPLLGPGNTKYPCPGGAPACPLPDGTLVTLGANAPQAALGGKSLLGVGFGIPCAVAPTLPQCGKPLPDGSFTPPATVNAGVLLYPDEVQAIDDRIKAMNDVIKAAASTNGFTYFDTYGFARSHATTGFDVGGIHISRDFVTGGFFSYGDPVHPSNIGYALFVDAVIQFINSTYSVAVPRPDLSAALFTPDVPAPGTTGAHVDTSVFFDEAAWRGFFEEFPLYDASMKIALPGGEETPDRAPVIVLPGHRSPRD